MTDGDTLRQALDYAARGWPVFPCQPGQKTPATTHGYLDATTSTRQITEWFTRHPGRNVAIATGAPGPDVLDVDQHGPAGSGFPALVGLRRAGLLTGASHYVRTPSGGLHLYFTGTAQHNGHLVGRHLDFRSAGGYILAPPSQVNGHPYQLLRATGRHGTLDWASVTGVVHPRRQPQPHPAQGRDLGALAVWVAAQPEGNRNSGLYWAANRALEADPAADLSPLAAAARQAGLGDPEITRTLNSAHRTSQPRTDHQAEAGDRR
jgi:Bifunctional DNA primase/polymerase, N-terminal